MTVLQITSISPPLDQPSLRAKAADLVRRAVGLGFLRDHGPVERLDLDLIRSIASEASSEGVGQEAATALIAARPSAATLGTLIDRLDRALVDSPVPARELRQLLTVYDVDALQPLLGASPASVRRYASGERAVPDDVAGRIHFVALVTSDLAGSYNEFGLRRWWDRPRTSLRGRSPRTALGTGWGPDDRRAVAVADLARSLVGRAAPR
jgi:hypothetical protein